jgi:PIN domain nuclease of toxin-antitoxin system
MRVLLDTHTFLWWLDGDIKLPKKVQKLIANTENEIYVSAASAWEICTKVRIGKLPGAIEIAPIVNSCITSQGFRSLPITVAHAQRAGLLSGQHRDPFDRMLIAQALSEQMSIATNEELFDSFNVERVW